MNTLEVLKEAQELRHVGLSPRQLLFVDALLEGNTLAEAARIVDVGRAVAVLAHASTPICSRTTWSARIASMPATTSAAGNDLAMLAANGRRWQHPRG